MTEPDTPCPCLGIGHILTHDGHCCFTHDPTRPPRALPACGHITDDTIWRWRRIARQSCPRSHAREDLAAAPDSYLGLIIKSNATCSYLAHCGVCDAKVPTTKALHQSQLHRLVYVDDSPFSREHRTCSVTGCRAVGIEMHHFAPRNTFGADADNWPVLPLCRHHHRQWHETMDGYRWHKPGEFAQ